MSESTDVFALTKAITNVMAEVHRLKKDEMNKHGGYKYVSVDDVKDHIRPLMAKHRLEMRITETEFSIDTLQAKSGPVLTAKIVFEITLNAVGELTAGTTDRITVALPYTGAQTTGAARSYAIKEWIKGRFLVSTGEKDMIEGGADADAYRQQEYSKPEVMPSVNGTHGASKAANRATFDAFVKAIRAAPTVKALADWHKTNVAEIDKLPADWLDELRVEYSDRKAELERVLA